MDRASLPDRLGRTQEVVGDEIANRFACGLSITTEVLHKPDPWRILPLGGSTCALLNRMANHPEMVRGRRVFEPFAGSGPLGLMALAQGARHAVLLDVNPRALAFQHRNAAASRIDPARLTILEGDAASHHPGEPYDVVLANPPFVPTPDGIAGTLTSNGGVDGSRWIELLLRRLSDWLWPGGEAWILMWQLAVSGRPLIAGRVPELAPDRPVTLHVGQARAVPLDASAWAYRKLFPDRTDAVDAWQRELEATHGKGLTACQYVMHLGPTSAEPTACTIRDDFAAEFGADFRIPAGPPEELAFGRAFENFVPGAG